MTLTAGEGPTVVDTDVGRLGIGICYDLRFPELSAIYAQRGVQLIVIPGEQGAARTAWPLPSSWWGGTPLLDCIHVSCSCATVCSQLSLPSQHAQGVHIPFTPLSVARTPSSDAPSPAAHLLLHPDACLLSFVHSASNTVQVPSIPPLGLPTGSCFRGRGLSTTSCLLPAALQLGTPTPHIRYVTECQIMLASGTPEVHSTDHVIQQRTTQTCARMPLGIFLSHPLQRVHASHNKICIASAAHQAVALLRAACRRPGVTRL